MVHRYSQKNTVDFDAARLQRSEQNAVPRRPLQPLTLPELHQRLNSKLQTTLETERLLSLFFGELQRLVPLDGMEYQQPSGNLYVQFGESAQHSVSYRLSNAGEECGEIVFRRRKRFDEVELLQLESLLGALFFPLRNALLYRKAIQNSLRDPLTGVGNRAAMEQVLPREVGIAQRHQQPLTVLMLDLDHFKRINDNYGHSTGDTAIVAVALSLSAQLRKVDMVFRFGGEEFLVLLSNTSGEAAAPVAERLREAVEQLNLQAGGEPLPLSVSIGGASLHDNDSLSSLLRRADDALYKAKREGRNQVVMRP